LTIGAIASAMIDTLPPFIEHLKTQFPQLTVSVKEIDSVEAVPALERGDIDLAFARLEGELGPSIQSLALKQDRLAVALPKTHRFAEMPRVRHVLAAFQSELLRQHHRNVPRRGLFATRVARSALGLVADCFCRMWTRHRARARFAEKDGGRERRVSSPEGVSHGRHHSGGVVYRTRQSDRRFGCGSVIEEQNHSADQAISRAQREIRSGVRPETFDTPGGTIPSGIRNLRNKQYDRY
jgi:hypothetical protein